MKVLDPKNQQPIEIEQFADAVKEKLAELEARVAALEARPTPNLLGPTIPQPREYPGDWPPYRPYLPFEVACQGPTAGNFRP